MPLPSVQDVKDYGRIQTSVEDALIAALLGSAIGEIEAAIGKSLTTEQVTWYDNATSLRLFTPPRNLLLLYVPVDVSTIVVADQDDATIDAATYNVRLDLGMICGNDGLAFGNGPYKITATAGFGTSPNYATRWLPMIAQLVKDYTLMLYQQRTIGASSEKAAGTMVTYEIDADTGLPCRLSRQLRKLRGPVV